MYHTKSNTFKKGAKEIRRRSGSPLYFSRLKYSENPYLHNHEFCCESKKRFFANDANFSAVLMDWADFNSVRLKDSTKKKYGYMIKTHIVPELGVKKISELTSSEINTFLSKKLNEGRLDGAGGLSHSYVRSIAIIISSALDFAAEEQNLSLPKIKIHKPIVHKKEPNLLSRQEQAILERYIIAHPCPTNAGILISLYTGLRIGEICALSWDDINLSDRIIIVNHNLSRIESKTVSTKTQLVLDSPKTLSSKRVVPISDKIISTLVFCKSSSVSDFVVSDKEGFVSPRTFEARYKKTLNQCGIRPVNFHALRHTFATRCIEAGVDVKSLSEILGHTNVSVTLNTYVHSSLDMKKKQMEKLSAFTV